MNDPLQFLPPDIARQINSLWCKNRSDYWTARDRLRHQHEGQWVGFADGRVIASGSSPVTVLHEAEATGRSPFVTCVGHEDEPCRIRRTGFAYETSYPGEALPVLEVEFRLTSGAPGPVLDRVIPDTGADASVLPWRDCQQLNLSPAAGRPGWLGGVAGGVTASLSYHMWIGLDGQEYPCRLQVDFAGGERILGRDVLNRLDILFRGLAREVVVNP